MALPLDKPKWRDPVVVLTFLAVIVAAIQTCIFRRQTTILDQQTTIQQMAVELSRSDQRARVGVPNVGNLPDLRTGVMPIVPVRWLNSGKTPAHNARGEARMDIRPAGIEFSPAYQLDARSMSSSTIPAGISQSTPATLGRRFTQQDLEGIRDQTLILYLYGYTTYSDDFGRTWRTEFACEYTPILPAWRILNSHNTAD